MRIKKRDILYFILMFFYIEPAFFQINVKIHNTFLFMQIFSFFILMFIYISQKIKPTKIILLLWIMLIELCIACQFGIGNIRTTLAAYMSYVGLSMWIDIYIRKDTKKCFNMLIILLDVYVIINFISILVFPKGMYVSQSFQNTPYVCWFLGYKNPQIRILLPYIVLLFVRDSIFNRRVKSITYIKLIIITLISIKLKSATGIFGVFVFIALNVMFSRKKISWIKRFILRILNIRVIYCIMIVINILVILFNFQNNFSFLIVNILHRDLDLTDRIYVWQQVIPVIKSNLIWGQGVIYAELSRSYIGASHAHNYFLNILYNGGIVLFTIISLIWLNSGKAASTCNKSLGVRYLKFMAIIFLIMGVTESLTSTVLLYPILTILYYSKDLEKIECVEGEKIEKFRT